MRVGKNRRRVIAADALVGVLSGLGASWVMERAQRPIMRAGGPAVKERERAARGGLEPSTIRAARRVAGIAGRAIPEERTRLAGQAVHYATGAAVGAVFGVLAPRLGARTLAAGTLFGIAVWLVVDEGLTPALGFSREPWRYPATTHAKAFVNHLVFGAATEASYRLLGATIR